MAERTILCFGDSNTHGTPALTHLMDTRRFARDVRWPGRMAAELGDGWHVIEEGLPSRTTTQDDHVEGLHKNGMAVLPALLDSHRPIDLVIVMLGTNDLKMRYNLPALDVAIAAGRLLMTIAQSVISGPDMAGPPRALLVAPVPIRETGVLAEMFAGGAEKSTRLARYYQAMAERNGAAFFDAGSVAGVDPLDGIHLTVEGHAALGTALAGQVRAMFGE